MARIFLDVETFCVRRSAQLEGEASSLIVYRRVRDICSVTAAFVPLARIGKMEVQEMNHGLFTHSASERVQNPHVRSYAALARPTSCKPSRAGTMTSLQCRATRSSCV